MYREITNRGIYRTDQALSTGEVHEHYGMIFLFIIFILKSCTDSNNLNRLKTTITGSSECFCSAMGTTSMVSTYIAFAVRMKPKVQTKRKHAHTILTSGFGTLPPCPFLDRPPRRQIKNMKHQQTNKLRQSYVWNFQWRIKGATMGRCQGLGAPRFWELSAKGPTNVCASGPARA